MALSFHRRFHLIALVAPALAFATWLLIGSLPASAAETGKLRVAVENSYRPFAYTDETGRLTGFDVEIAERICAELNRDCEIIAMPFDTIIPSVARGDIDIGALGLGITHERKQMVDFTDHYFRSQSIFIEKPGTVKNLSAEGMAGKRVGAQPGSLQEEHLRKTYGPHISLELTPDFEQLFKNLQAGRTDIIFVDGLPGYTVLKSPLGDGLETLGPPIPDNIVSTSAHMIVPKGRPELLQGINKAIMEIVRSGEYAKINRKYFEFNVY